MKLAGSDKPVRPVGFPVDHQRTGAAYTFAAVVIKDHGFFPFFRYEPAQRPRLAALEAAFFEPGVVRRASRRHQLPRDAAYRFERQADWDAVVDDYFPVLEHCGEGLEDLEDEVASRPDSHHINRIHDMKRELLTMRRAVWPHREMINAVIRDENPLVSGETRLYLRDVYDHTLQLIDIIETYREIATGLMEVYMSSVSVKLNETMKVLTVIATIFIPLGFVASLYGMNFDRSVSAWNMPELGWKFGYPFSLALMTLIAAAMLFYFRRKGWLGARRRDGGLWSRLAGG